MTENALRGGILTFTGNPFHTPVEQCMCYESDGVVVIKNGRIKQFGPAQEILDKLKPHTPITHYPRCLILPGFIDCHVHYPQMQIIGAFGQQLLEWLNRYVFVSEQQYGDKAFAKAAASKFLKECLRVGTTTASVFCTVHLDSVDAFFEESEKLNMRNIAGKVLMDRNAPLELRDTPQKGYDDTKHLINKWHNKGRQLYSVTPRFAPTSSPEQMEMTGAVWNEHPGTYLQSHISENLHEINWANKLYPDRKSYVDIHDHYHQLGPRAIYGHGLHLKEAELQRLHDTGTAIAHCPTSGLFLGSGIFNIENTCDTKRPVRVGLATDIGAGTSFSPLQTMNEAYKMAQAVGYALNPAQAFYLATLGAAHALYLDTKIGSIAVGKEADLAILDLHSTPIIDYRMQYVNDIHEALFVQMILGDDRAIRATFIAGELRYDRDNHDLK